MEPIKIDIDNSKDLIGSPVQNHEQITTHTKVNARINRDFLDNVCLIILFIFDIRLVEFQLATTINLIGSKYK